MTGYSRGICLEGVWQPDPVPGRAAWVACRCYPWRFLESGLFMHFSGHFGLFPVAAVLAAIAATAACSTASEPASFPATACTDPRPQVCTMIYMPVCAVREDASRETLASACNACADATVSGYSDGPCDDGNAE